MVVDGKTAKELLQCMTLSSPPTALQVVLRELAFADGEGDLDEMDQIISRDLIDHSPYTTSPDQSAYDAMRELFGQLRTGYSDYSHRIHFIMELPDNWVVFHHEFVGTHTGDFLGFPATGNRISMKGTEISHIVDGKVAEIYHNEDSLSLFSGLQGGAK